MAPGSWISESFWGPCTLDEEYAVFSQASTQQGQNPEGQFLSEGVSIFPTVTADINLFLNKTEFITIIARAEQGPGGPGPDL